MLLTLLRFVLLGPLIGSMVIYAMMMVQGAPEGSAPGSGSAMAPIVFIFGYAAGFLPALVTGLVAGWRKRVSRSAMSFLLPVVVTGMLVSIVTVSLTVGYGLWVLDPLLLLYEAAPGGMAALVCGEIELLLMRRQTAPPSA